MPVCPFCAEEISRTSTVCPHCNSELNSAHVAPQRAGKPSSSATLWISVLAGVIVVMLGCAGVLVALLLPAVHQARMAARTSMSQNHLKQIALAFHNYHDTHGTLPPGGIVDESGRGHHGWMTMLLPYLDQYPLFEQIDFDEPWDDGINAIHFQVQVPTYLNPAINRNYDDSGFAVAHYAGNKTVLEPNHGVMFGDVTDGLSYTFLAGEINDNFLPWGHPENYRDLTVGINRSSDGFGSPFLGGANVMMMDGSIRFISEHTDPAVLKAISTPAGGEPNTLLD